MVNFHDFYSFKTLFLEILSIFEKKIFSIFLFFQKM